MRYILVCAAAALFPGVAWSADATAWRLTYDAYIGGFRVLSIAARARYDARAYDIEVASKTLRADHKAPLQLAEILLLDEGLLPDEEGPTGEVADQADIKRVRQEKPAEGGNTQTQQIGETTNSQAIGQVRTRGVVDNLQQSQAGRANVQQLGVGAVTDSHVVGNVDINAHLQQGDQHQSGESNQQGMSLGGLR